MGIKDLLLQDDPLSQEAIDCLLEYREEDLYVDYKEDFDPNVEKHWLGITADAMAFANTSGGYIVFGVRDGDFQTVGVSEEAYKALTNTNLVLQKLNRFIAPPFVHIRTKGKRVNDSISVSLMFIPESKGKTHIVVKEASFEHISGKTGVFLRPGMIYIRRSATNHIVDPTDLDFIVDRRIDHFRNSLMGRIARVIEAPPEHEVIVFDPTPHSADGKAFVISDAPEAIPIKGMSFTISPRSNEQEVAAWIALGERDQEFTPRPERLWHLYSIRHELKLSESQVRTLAYYCLLIEVPAFYWIRGLDADSLKEILGRALGSAKGIDSKATIVRMGAFLGKGFYHALLAKVGKYRKHLNPRDLKIPANGPMDFFPVPPSKVSRLKPSRKNAELIRENLENELTNLAKKLSDGTGGAIERIDCLNLDCYLYARADKYQKKQAEEKNGDELSNTHEHLCDEVK